LIVHVPSSLHDALAMHWPFGVAPHVPEIIGDI
jgi:hypothetical protein